VSDVIVRLKYFAFLLIFCHYEVIITLYFGAICVYSKYIIGGTSSLHICKHVSLLQTVLNMLGLIANGGIVVFQIFAFYNAPVW